LRCGARVPTFSRGCLAKARSPRPHYLSAMAEQWIMGLSG
jgi:hypothetical protein